MEVAQLCGWLAISIGLFSYILGVAPAYPSPRWLWQKDKYVALKIHASAHPFRENAAENELDILRHIAKANPSHKGWRFVRYPIDSFDLPLRSVPYLCLVFEPLREPLWLLRYRFIDSVIPPDTLKVLVQMILHGLDYLHSECRIIHAGMF